MQIRGVIPPHWMPQKTQESQASEGLFQWVKVQHFNPRSRQFDGPKAVVRIPNSLPDRNGIPRFVLEGIEQSPLNEAGWYIYGGFAIDPVSTSPSSFAVQALEPRSLMQVQPTMTVASGAEARAYITRENWSPAKTQKGTAASVWVQSSHADYSDHSGPQEQDKWKDEGQDEWEEGDRALVVHLYGGIGGDKAEPTLFGVTTGHFSYGVANVITDPLTQELRFSIEYQQIYAHNSDGIVASPVQWSEYMGNLQRGWQGTRPVSDVLIDFPPVTQDYNFDGIVVSPMDTFVEQLNRMMARYRIGDGTGASIVTPSTSCVQDSNQALYITIKAIEKQVRQTPAIKTWLATHPDHPQTQRFRSLIDLGRALERQLVPLGMIRADWQQTIDMSISDTMTDATDAMAGQNPNGTDGSMDKSGGDRSVLAGIGSNHPATQPHPMWLALSTWRTLLPRRSHDEITTIFLEHGASLWVLRTNQVGGINPDITPRVPNTLLGQ
ncbi:MAG: hypothetical protein F6K09_09535 [Merismopedia sp. SIO2A8]|nr:hypothetical protein [Merismopedia sp. SIO2A8]